MACKADRSRLDAAMDAGLLGICEINPDGVCSSCNVAGLKLLGYEKEGQLLGKRVSDLFADYPVSHRSHPLAPYLSTASLPRPIHVPAGRLARADGSCFYADYHIYPIVRHGELISALLIFSDLEEQQKNRQMLAVFRQVAEQNPTGIMVTDRKAQILYINHQFSVDCGYRPEELRGLDFGILGVARNAGAVRYDIWNRLSTEGLWCGELPLSGKNGRRFWVRTRIMPLYDPQCTLIRYVHFCENITAEKVEQRRQRLQEQHDELTGLANRSLLLSRLDRALEKAGNTAPHVALLLLNIDRFKVVNDALGHESGDELLCLIGQRLKQCVRTTDTVARLVADEYAIVLTDIQQIDDIQRMVERIRTHLAEPYHLARRRVAVTVSIGIGIAPQDGADRKTLLVSTRVALDQAKQTQDTYFFYAATMSRDRLDVFDVENDLRVALEREEFRLHYQPKVDLDSGRITGCEALLRWQRPEHGLVPPLDFIPLAEETGLIVPIGGWVIRQACRQSMAWQAEGLFPVPVAVNLSARQFQRSGLTDLVRNILQETGLDPCLLELELTESMVMDDPHEALATMHELKALGVSLSLDDFGTGYSSLNYLRHFPVDNLKIDQSFIRDVTTDPSCASVVSSIIDIAHNLKIIAIAEGLNCEEELDFLRQAGCDMVQGHYFSKPLPPAEFADLLRSEKHLAPRLSLPGSG